MPGATVGKVVAKESLDKVAEVLGVLNHDEDFLPVDVKERCEAIVPEIAEVKCKDAAGTFLFLKAHYVYTQHYNCQFHCV